MSGFPRRSKPKKVNLKYFFWEKIIVKILKGSYEKNVTAFLLNRN